MKKVYKIEKDVPIPKRGRKPMYPFGDMDVGDSFVFANPYSRSAQSRAGCAIRTWMKHSPIENVTDRIYITRRVDNTVRVWRIR